MKKENREMLKLILKNQELIMKALNVQMSDAKTEETMEAKPVAKKVPAKKAATKKSAKKISKKK